MDADWDEVSFDPSSNLTGSPRPAACYAPDTSPGCAALLDTARHMGISIGSSDIKC